MSNFCDEKKCNLASHCEMTEPDHVAYRSSLDVLSAKETDELGLVLSRETHCFKSREETYE